MKAITCANCGAQLSPASTSCWACKQVVAGAGQAVAVAASSGGPVAASSGGPVAIVLPPVPTVSTAPPRPAPRPPVQPPVKPAAASLVDAEPILERSVHGIFSKAEGVRDHFYLAFERELAARGIRGLVLKSTDYEHPCWVSVSCWMPVNGRALTERGSAVIRIIAKSYHRSDLEYEVTLTGSSDTWTGPRLHQVSDEHIREIVNFVTGRGPRPNFRNALLRQYPWQIHRPVNKVQAVRKDWLAALPGALYSVGLATAALGVGILLLIAGVIAQWRLKKRRTVVLSGGKPTFEPRNLVRVDSWQTVINDAGPDAPRLRQELLAAVSQPPSPGFAARTERIWYWSLDTKEEREQIVLTFNRGVVFCQVHSYGRELYLGWDAHLNRGTWVEQTVATGVDRSSGRLTEVRAVTGGTQPVTEYDVSDVSCLLEWVHLQFVRIVKDYLAKKQINQEIDFKILRGDRQQLAASVSTGQQRPGGFVHRVRRAVGQAHA